MKFKHFTIRDSKESFEFLPEKFKKTFGLLRDYFPKKTDFSMIPESEILKVEHSLNSRPRKQLGWRTPLEVWSVALTH